MVQAVRAIYEHGSLRLLDSVELTEGEQVSITIVSERDAIRAALTDLLVSSDDADEDLNEEVLMQEIEQAFQGHPPLSETILQERREGP
ncbi:MAG: antitoxin family protein [Anaerolineae bacterium]|nr:antitoxin family protein [Anaerolineae bacterium]